MVKVPYEQLADLLAYPSADTVTTAERCAAALSETPAAQAAASEFAAAARAVSPTRLEEVYSGTFDLSQTSCPYLGYHRFGESPKRAIAMVHLKEEYRSVGLSVDRELPDHVCLLLRFLARTGDEELAAELRAELLLPGLDKMLAGLAGRDNPYVHALRATQLATQADQPVTVGGGDA